MSPFTKFNARLLPDHPGFLATHCARILFLCLLTPLLSPAQQAQPVRQDVSGIPIPMKKSIVFYEKSYTLDNAGISGSSGTPGSSGNTAAQKQDLYTKALRWFSSTFPTGRKSPIKPADHIAAYLAAPEISIPGTSGKPGSSGPASNGEITRTETFKVLTGDTAVNYYYITVTMHVTFSADSYTFQVYNFYEKPVQKGVSNDYSKIEYRWRDFRYGHPWFNTDKALFTGLNDQTLAYLDSFQREMAGR